MTGAAQTRYDAVIVGAGPNGLAAAIHLARAGLSTVLFEAAAGAGGGTKSAALTLPGFVHDVCSAVHPLGAASPFFRTLDLQRHGLEWIPSPTPLAHVLADGTAILLERSVAETAAQLGRDAGAYRALMDPLVENFDSLIGMILSPLRWPAAPLRMARFGARAVRSMRGLAASRFRGTAPGALLAGIAAHSMVPLEQLATASFALVLASAGHAVGWPITRGGSQAIADALVAHYRSLGGEVVLDTRVSEFRDLPFARAYLFNVSPKQLLAIAGEQLPPSYQEKLAAFRYGPGVFKVDWALSEPIPWRDPRCRRAVTVHLSGNLDDIAAAEAAVHAGEVAPRPFVLLAQQSLIDDSRAPPGKHTAWAYCHVPNGTTFDALERIEAHVEHFAPGFRDVVLARATRNACEMEVHNLNYVGGDINCGLSDLRQLFFRPAPSFDPYATPARHIFLCSSATPPGGGVHGMSGYWAARSALRHVFGALKVRST